MLELVTGKRPTDPSFIRKGLNIVGWVRNILDVDCMVKKLKYQISLS